MRIVDGLGSDVLPMPYHIAPIPTPWRIGRVPAADADSSSASRQAGRNASRHGARPALASST
jgi:hypothetical protein